MPDLSHKASSQYWYEFPDPMIYRVITFMESVENWTLDGTPELEGAIAKLGNELDHIEKIDLGALAADDYFVRLIGNLKSGRGLRILQALDSLHPGSASKILIHAEEMSSHDAPASFFLKRNIVFERLRLLARVFAENRLKLVARTLEGEE